MSPEVMTPESCKSLTIAQHVLINFTAFYTPAANWIINQS